MEETHYSRSIFGITASHCFKVEHLGQIVGAAIFGSPAGKGVAQKYAKGGPLLELRRFVLASECERNSESRTLAIMLRELRKQGVAVILSYADPAHGHSGIIYKATGFAYCGKTASRKHFVWKGKTYPDRNVHQVNFPFHLELRAAIASGEAQSIRIPGKHIYIKELQA